MRRTGEGCLSTEDCSPLHHDTSSGPSGPSELSASNKTDCNFPQADPTLEEFPSLENLALSPSPSPGSSPQFTVGFH